MTEDTTTSSIELATELTIAWLGNQHVRATAEDVPAFLRQMHATLNELSSGAPESESSAANGSDASEPGYEPAVSVRKSLSSREHIISLIDGKPYKALKRHLARHGLTPEQYRERYKLKPEYPMVAPTYSETRRAMAHKIGLGRQGSAGGEKEADAPAAPKRRSRTPKAPAEAS